MPPQRNTSTPAAAADAAPGHAARPGPPQASTSAAGRGSRQPAGRQEQGQPSSGQQDLVLLPGAPGQELLMRLLSGRSVRAGEPGGTLIDAPGRHNKAQPCLICGKDKRAVVFEPCGHKVLCQACFVSIVVKQKGDCPQCCTPVESHHYQQQLKQQQPKQQQPKQRQQVVPNDEPDDDFLCVMCMDRKRTIVLVPCGHMALCRGCCDKAIMKQRGNCPLCNAVVEFHVQMEEEDV